MRFNLFNGNQTEMVQFQITPDRETDNKKAHELFRGLSSFYASILDIWQGKVPGVLWWDMMIKHDSVRFYATLPAEYKQNFKIMIQNTWEGCSIEETELKSTAIPIHSDVCEMKYRRSNLFALQTDRRTELEPLNNLLSIVNDMQSEDIARYSVCADPISRLDYQDWAQKQFEGFKKGNTPKRAKITTKDILLSLGEFVTVQLQSLLDVVHMAIGGDQPKEHKQDDYEKRIIMIDGQLSKGTMNKLISPTFNTYIRIAAHSTDKHRQQVIIRSMSNSFHDLTADNELERNDYHDKLKPVIVRELNDYKLSWLTKLDINKNKMSNEELGRLAETPTSKLQHEYEQIDALDSRQIQVPQILLKGGLSLGTVKHKRTEQEVFFPTNDHDQLCLPSVVLGGMGSGKTKGFGCNRAIGFVKSGYSSIIFDPAKSEVWEQIEKALPKEKRKRIRLGQGQQPISLDFCEVNHSPGAKSRLANLLITFFEDSTDTAGAQTQRFLRAAVMGMQTGKLTEILKIFKDIEYRKSVIDKLPEETLAKESLIEFDSYSADRQRQILAPILNRLDVIFGDEFLSRCIKSNNTLNMVEILSKRGVCTVFDIPDRLNDREAKNILINLISFKLDIAMPFRRDEFPFSIIYDEPHQYLRSVNLWKNVAVEARKYRLSYTWLFHSWEQIPRDLSQIIKDAGPHYFLYGSSKDTYKGLKEEITPFTIEDGLQTKRYHAICALKVGNGRITPFMARMTAPV